jgi:hypothetical protein
VTNAENGGKTTAAWVNLQLKGPGKTTNVVDNNNSNNNNGNNINNNNGVTSTTTKPSGSSTAGWLIKSKSKPKS